MTKKKTDEESGEVVEEAKGSSKETLIAQDELTRLKEKAAQADEHWEKILRLTADFDNTKKRLEKRKAEAVAFANETILSEVLHLVDDLERAYKSFEENHKPESIKEGLNIIRNNFDRLLKKHGVEPVDSIGKSFDPHMHEAIGEVETRDFKEGEVAEEIQKGYSLNGRLIRPSKVRVAKNNEKEDSQREENKNGIE